ncbi:MAG: hypothetical protein KAR39_13275 [Thermoplasmata archaeon]|nr:hypothetical protein [Thermoplasmata archaeon]
MTKGIGQIRVRKSHGVMVVTAYGQTPQGKKYIKGSVPLKAKDPASPGFKSEVAQAVNELFGSGEPV